MYKAALYYSQKLGWPVFPVHSVKNGQCSCGNVKCGNKGKHPRTLNGFYDATNDKAAVDQWWTRWPESNIGVPTGPLSGLAVLDVDVGHAKNVNGLETLAAHPELVVSTETGPAFSTGSGGMHVLYAYPEQGVTSGPTDLPGLEVKGSGGYIVVPPSTHAYGRDYAVLRWPHEHQVPAFPPALAAARARHKVTETAIPENGQKVPASARHGYLLSLGRRLCKSGLSRDSAFPALRAECNARCESPDEKGDLEIDSIIRWVWDKIEPDTPAAQTPPYGPIKSPLNPPSASATSAQSPAKHHAQLAVAFCESEHGHADGPTIRHYAGQFWWWRGGAYRPVSNDEIDASIYRFLPLDLISNAELVSGIRRALTYHVSLPASTDLPSWLNTDSQPFRPQPKECLATPSGILHVPTRKMLSPSPAYFTQTAIPYDYDPEAEVPERWLQFLVECWPSGPASRALLQKVMGYLLLPDNSQQKLFMLIGAPGAGKGTISRVIRHLIGPENYAALSVSSLAERFGLSGCIGKSVAVVNDARFHGEGALAAVERMLEISGGDCIHIDRKNLPPISTTLPLRLLLISNDVPTLPDSANALARRLKMLSFDNPIPEEIHDPLLTDTLCAGAPGILNWSLDGYDALRREGWGDDPDDSAEDIADLLNQSSPLGGFLEERCEADRDAFIDRDALYTSYKGWADAGGYFAMNRSTFFRNLRAHCRAARIPLRDWRTKHPNKPRERLLFGLTLKVV